MFDVGGAGGRRRQRRLFRRREEIDVPPHEPEEEQSPEREEASRRAATAVLGHLRPASQALTNFTAWERFPPQRRPASLSSSSSSSHQPLSNLRDRNAFRAQQSKFLRLGHRLRLLTATSALKEAARYKRERESCKGRSRLVATEILRALVVIATFLLRTVFWVLRFAVRSASHRQLVERVFSVGRQLFAFATGRDLYTGAAATAAGFTLRSVSPDLLDWAYSLLW